MIRIAYKNSENEPKGNLRIEPKLGTRNDAHDDSIAWISPLTKKCENKPNARINAD
jgi:hypothetical protein